MRQFDKDTAFTAVTDLLAPGHATYTRARYSYQAVGREMDRLYKAVLRKGR